MGRFLEEGQAGHLGPKFGVEAVLFAVLRLENTQVALDRRPDFFNSKRRIRRFEGCNLWSFIQASLASESPSSAPRLLLPLARVLPDVRRDAAADLKAKRARERRVWIEEDDSAGFPMGGLRPQRTVFRPAPDRG
jgi:hypothetical protein